MRYFISTMHMSLSSDWNILALDRGRKYIGCAYQNVRANVVMPVGYLMNDQSFYFNMSDVIARYKITKIIVGYPKQHEDHQKEIDVMIERLLLIDEKLNIERVDEEYTSVQSGEVTGNFKKNIAEDTVAAMFILEAYLEKKKSST